MTFVDVKKLALAAMFAAFAVAPAGGASAQQSAPPVERFPAELDRYIAKVLADGNIPGIGVAVVRNDSVMVARGYGVRELGKPARVDEHTVFDIASLSKSFTATAIAMLVDKGVVHWDDPVRRHLPGLVLPNEELNANATMRDFLSHRTGIEAANMMWVPTGVDRQEVLRRMQFFRIVAPFRQTMTYSNVGYTVAGEAAAAAAHMSFDAMLRDLVIKPLRLASTTWTYDQAATMPNVSASHATVAGKQQVVPREKQRQPVAAAAAVQSSMSDLTRWMRLHLNDGVLDGTRYVSDSAMRAMHSMQVIIPTTPEMRAARSVEGPGGGYGMGWQVMDYRGHPLIWHTGNGNGQIAYMALLPRDRIGIVVVVNTWVVPMVHMALVSRIMDAYLGFEPRDWAAEPLARMPRVIATQDSATRAMIAMRSPTPPPLPLNAYAGRYDHDVFGPIIVRNESSGLTLQMGTGQIADLEYHGGGDTFYTRWRDPFFREYYGTHITFSGAGDTITTLRTRLNRDEFTATKKS